VSVIYNPPIVTNGMALCLDAANAKSYSGSGATWTDLSGYGNNGTLVNGPTFDSANGGSLVFNGSTQYADFTASNLTTTATIEIWAKLGAGFSGKMIMGWNNYDIYCAQPHLFVKHKNASRVIINSIDKIDADFVVYAERCDIAKLQPEEVA